MVERIEESKVGNPTEIVHIASDQGEIVNQAGRRDQGVTERHASLLAEFHGLVEDRLIDGQNRRTRKEELQRLPFFFLDLMESQDFDIAYRRDC